MTRTVLVAVVGLLVTAAPAWCAPDLARIDAAAVAAEAELAGAKAEVESLKGQRATLERVLLAAADVSADKDAAIDRLGKDVAKRDEWLAQARSFKWTLLCLFVGGLGCLFLLAGTVGFVLDVGRVAAKCLVIAVPLIAGSAGLIFYGPQYAWAGIVVAGVVSLGGLAWIVWDVRQTQDAAIELADGVQQIENSGAIGEAKRAKDVLNQALGKLASKLFKKATA